MFRLKSDEGMALLTVVLLVAGMIGLGTLMITVSTRTNESSVEQRVREAALQAADAGVSDSVACVMRLGSDGFTAGIADCESTLNSASYETQLGDEGRDIGEYEIAHITDVTSQHALLPGEKMIEVEAVGHAPRKSGGRFQSARGIVARVKLEPFGGFLDTIFAGGPGGTVEVNNNARIDGSVYAEDLNLVKNNAVVGDVRTPLDFVTKNNDVYRSIWSGGDVAMGNNSSVTNDVRVCGDPAPGSEKGNIALESGASIGGDLVYRGTADVSGPSNDDIEDRVDGDVNVPTNECLPPPTIGLPIYDYDADDYTLPNVNPAWTIVEFTGTDAAADANTCLSTREIADQPGVCNGETLGSDDGRLGGQDGTVVRVEDPSCPSSAGPVELDGSFRFENDFTLSTNCKFELGGTWSYDQATFVSSAQAVFVSESATGDADIDVPKSLLVSDSSLSVLLFTNGELRVRNNLNVSAGALYANAIQVNNNLDMGHSASLEEEPPAGFVFDDTARYIPFIHSWREAPTS